MSKLINDQSPPSVVAPPMQPLTGATVISHLKACQKLATDQAHAWFQRFAQDFELALVEQMNQAHSNHEAQELSGVLRLFRDSRKEVERYYCGYLAEGFVKFKKRELQTLIGGSGDVAQKGLSLLGHDDLDESIAITSLTQRADVYLAEPIWALNQRFSVLNGGEHVSEFSNPATPIQLCESLRKSIKCLALNNALKTLAYKVYDRHLIPLARSLVEDINGYLKAQGILPNLRYSLPKGEAPASFLSEPRRAIVRENDKSPPAGPDQNLSPDKYQAELLSAIRELQDQLIFSAAAAGSTAPGNLIEEAELLAAVQQLQQETRLASGLEANPPALKPLDFAYVADQLSHLLQDGMDAAKVKNSDLNMINLVGMLFEYMLGDENLPDRVKALLSYLHTPFLKIAFVDPGFFEQLDHPARVLLNNLAEAGARWVGNDGTDQYDIYAKIKQVVESVLSDFDKDLKVITSLLLDFNIHTKNIARRQDLVEKRAMEKAQGEEKLREVKLRVNEEVRHRTHNRELPSALLLFLLQPWSDFMSFTLLRYGDQSDKWIKALAVVDEVLWAVRPKTKNEDKAKQMEVQDAVIERIQAGFDTIGFDPHKGQQLIDAISALMNLALQSKKAEPAPAPMRHKLEQIAAEKAGMEAGAESLASAEEAQMLEKLKQIEFGTWFEFEGGRRLKIAWFNARTSHYMLVDQMGKRVGMISGLDMARQLVSGEAKMISGVSKPFFERALESIFHKLHEKAETHKSSGEPQSGH